MKERELREKGNYKEKNLYEFSIKKEISFEGEDYFVLKSEFGDNILLNKKYYDNYHLFKEKHIKCYVDKINCTGEIFLEPIHPFYKLKASYEFKIIGSGKHKIKELVDYGMFVENKFKDKIFVPMSRENVHAFRGKSTIFLKVNRIKKGVFRLEFIK